MPKTHTLLSILLFPFLFVSCRASRPTPITSLPDPSGWKLAFSDEFDGKELDPTKWNTYYPWVENGGCTNSGNNELDMATWRRA